MIKTASKMNLFFLELTLMILILSLSMAVCVQVFYHAQTTAEYSRDLSNATIVAQSAAASYKAFSGDLDKMAEFMNGSCDADKMAAYYDKEWQPAKADNGAYRLSVSEIDRVGRIMVFKLKDQSELFSIDVKAVDYE